MAFLRMATQDSGANVDAATHLHRWVSENPNFEDIVYREYWLPTVPPIPEDAVQTERERRFYSRMKCNVIVRMIYLEEEAGISSLRLTISLAEFSRLWTPSALE